MATKRVLLVICSLIGLFLIFFGCRKPCTKNHYDFNGTSVFSPEKDGINIGDTIWFNSIISIKNLDTKSNQIIDYSGASNVSTQINFNTANSTDPTIGSIDSFKFIKGKGEISINTNFPQASMAVTYVEEKDNYLLSFGIIAIKKGVYVITEVDLENSYKKCSDAYVTITLNNINKHQHYLDSTYYPNSPYGNTIPLIVQTHSYCFKVY
ncbi:MAG: hypothetical protein ABI691_05260 [Ginsengibacter sp.]